MVYCPDISYMALEILADYASQAQNKGFLHLQISCIVYSVYYVLV